MGHYASEVDPNWGAEIDRTNRKIKLREKIDEMPLSKFKGKHFSALKRLYSHDGLSKNQFNILEELAKGD